MLLRVNLGMMASELVCNFLHHLFVFKDYLDKVEHVTLHEQLFEVVFRCRGRSEPLLQKLEFFVLVIQFVVGFGDDFGLVVQVLLALVLDLVEAGGREALEHVVGVCDHEFVELKVAVDFVEVFVRYALDSAEV